mgnify:CR=1 FL=1
MKTRLPLFCFSMLFIASSDIVIAQAQNSNPEEVYKTLKYSPIAKQTNKKPLIGLYDLQFGLGAITNGEMGIDIDLGATLANMAYGNSDASTTVELHYDHAREQFDHSVNYMHFRRNNLYARIRPFTSSPTSESNFNNILAMIVAGLYADIGYSTANYFYKDYLDNRLEPDYQANGLFWGWGWNLIWRSENRWGATFGFGSKRYRVELPNGTESKYKIRTISLGTTYNLIWVL